MTIGSKIQQQAYACRQWVIGKINPRSKRFRIYMHGIVVDNVFVSKVTPGVRADIASAPRLIDEASKEGVSCQTEKLRD